MIAAGASFGLAGGRSPSWRASQQQGVVGATPLFGGEEHEELGIRWGSSPVPAGEPRIRASDHFMCFPDR
jgi:hypothetical protein